MTVGQKLFEETGKISGLKVVKVHPLEGLTTEMTSMSDIRGVGKYPSGKNLASGTITKYSHGIIDGSWQGTLTTEIGEEFMWWSHEKSRVVKGGKIKGLNITTGFTNSQELSWMNNLIIVIDLAGSVLSDEFSAIGYEWIC
jgi:hypothetical protein